jgi:hypothetical protein
MVATEAGLRAIETVREGERVWAKDLRDGQWKLRHVLQTFERMNDGVLLSLKVAGEEIRVTPGHPFWVVEGQDLQSRPWPSHVGTPLAASQLPGRWVDAGELRLGDVLYLKSGALEAIDQIERHEVWEKVYNLQIEELECYAVGSSQVLVHNSSTNLNTNTAISIFGLYEITRIGGRGVPKGSGPILHKIGKADLKRKNKAGIPRRLASQLRKLRRKFGKNCVKGRVVKNLGRTTTQKAKAAETARLQAYYDRTGIVPKGNELSFFPE